MDGRDDSRVRSPEAGGPPDGNSAGQGAGPSSRGASDSDNRPSLAAPPNLSLPKSGGAIRGIGEKFSTKLTSGTGSLTVPIAVTPGRGDATPHLELAYDSGSGNGPFGLGWSLSIPSVSRRTDKRLPRYRDDATDPLERDTFMLSGAEDLVPALAEGTRAPIVREQEGFEIQRYRPRTEGPFALIERWRDPATGDTHWRSTDREGTTSIYGRSPEAQIVAPDGSGRVFRWLLEQTLDVVGNITAYFYTQENGAGVDRSLPHEVNRWAAGTAAASRYPKRVLYGNRVPGLAGDWAFELVFDYGDHADDSPTPQPTRAWKVRADAFSSGRQGFEVRTYRLCRRVLMFHRFSELGAEPCLVRSTDLGYRDDPVATELVSVTHAGYIRHADGSYDRDGVPSLELGYCNRSLSDEVADLSSDHPGYLGIGGPHQHFVDLDSEGIPGILSDEGGAWYYRRGEGGGRVSSPKPLRAIPSMANLAGGRQQLLPVAGEGRLDLVQMAGPMSGFHSRTDDFGWDSFRPFAKMPNLDWSDPNLRFVDLDGDGLADILITSDEALTWYPWLGSAGAGPAEAVVLAPDEERGPRLVFADAEQSIHLADMTGDGLSDLVRIRNGEVSYWPNLGYGRFGPRVAMSRPPLVDRPDQFDHRRVRLADVEGSGGADLIYLASNGVRIWFNEAGNAYSEPHDLAVFPEVDDLSQVSVADVLGTGMACLLWSSPLAPDEPRATRYVDLMGGRKPRMLESMRNNLGAETRIEYVSSTEFYLADRAAGQPWITRPPFPIHVVATVETRDRITDSKLVNTYRYRHGYYDGVEREFRGFGYVEKTDTQSFGRFSGAGLFATPPDVVEERLFLPPTVTKTWYHTGYFEDRADVLRHYAAEYWQGGDVPVLAPIELPAVGTADEEREACRALSGHVLREEIYARDGSLDERVPYSVSEHSYAIRLLQPRAGELHAVVHVCDVESLTAHLERHAGDPRVSHELTLAVDNWGNTVRSARVAYPRRVPRDPEQDRLRVVYIESDVLNRPDPEKWRLGVEIETRLYEVSVARPAAGSAFGPHDLATKIGATADIPFEANLSGAPGERRLLERGRTTYWSDNISSELPLGDVGLRALAHTRYRQAYTTGLIADVFAGRVTDAMLTEAGYRQIEGAWWSPSGHHVPDPALFYQPVRWVDAFGSETVAAYDAHALAVVSVTDPLGNVTSVRLSYRVMHPYLMTDPNGNRTGVRFDGLGMVVATAAIGKEGAGEGDVLDLSSVEAAPRDDPTTLIEYDVRQWVDYQRPVFAHTLVRERHGALNPRWQEAYSYSTGSGAEVMKKIQAEPGLAPYRDANRQLARNPDGTLATKATTEPRWVGTGRLVVDNKGNHVKEYQPFFAPDRFYEPEKELAEMGVTPILRYDPLSRLVATEFPNGTLSRTEFDAWEQATWDENDTVEESRWLADRALLPADDPERIAAEVTRPHGRTPGRSYLDSESRAYLVVADNGGGELHESRFERDVQGNQRTVTDARGNRVMVQRYDMLRRVIYACSVDAGESWTLADVTGEPLRLWTARGHAVRKRYDPLRRPTHLYVSHGGGPERLLERTVFGEALAGAVDANLRTRPYAHYDNAGVVVDERFDFKGNVLRSTRRLAREYQTAPDWSPLAELSAAVDVAAAAESLLESERFVTETAYDALNRLISVTQPDGTETRPRYNEANLLERVEARLRGGATWTSLVSDLNYNEKGQRVRVALGNGVVTDSTYDPLTFRLRRQRSTAANGAVLQDLSYTFDPVGNVVQTSDGAQPTLFYANAVVSAERQLTYYPVYWLKDAGGREHVGQTAVDQPGPSDPAWYALPHVNDLQAVRRYAEHYEYDPAGNLIQTVHAAGSGSWTRTHAYGAGSNRLESGSRPGDPPAGPFADRYQYDLHGNMTRTPHLRQLDWDSEDRLHRVDLGGGGTAYYTYDSHGERVRKVVERIGGMVDERVYVGGFELYRRSAGGSVTESRESLHVLDGHKRIALVDTATVVSGAPVATPEPVIRFQLVDNNGSTIVEIDGAGALLSYEEFHPFGSTSFHAATGIAQVSLKRYRFTGEERDDETGFQRHGERLYAVWLGRWTSPDPAGIVDTLNVYVYVRNNPASQNDPSGTWSWRTVAVVAAVVVVGTAVTIATAGVAGPLVVGAVASVGLSGAAATVVTGVVVSAVAGAAGGAASELTRQVGSGEQINGRAIGTAALSGAAAGAVTGGVSSALTAVRGGAAAASTAARSATTGARVARAAATAAHGAGTGALGSATAEGARQVISGEHLNGRGIARAAGYGAVIGGSLAAAGPAIRPLTSRASNALENVSTRAGVGLAGRLYGTQSVGGRAAAFYAVQRGISLAPAGPSASATGRVNIDTGTANALVSADQSSGATASRASAMGAIGSNRMVMSRTAINEFARTTRVAGSVERGNTWRFLHQVEVVPDQPSARAMGLNVTRRVGSNDRIVFGTGETLGAPTITTDAKFVRGAAAQGVTFNPPPHVHAPVPLKGQ